MMIPSEFDDSMKLERIRKAEERNFSYIIKCVEEYPDIITLHYNDFEKPKEKTTLEQIIDSVYSSLKGLSPYITYSEVKQRVTQYMNSMAN